MSGDGGDHTFGIWVCIVIVAVIIGFIGCWVAPLLMPR
jgi:hypothetical protein